MAEEKTELKKEDQKQPQDQKSAKKWKGKDWFVISAPKMFNSVSIAETPAMDSSSLIGRKVRVNVAQLTGQASKYYMNVSFKVNGVEGKNASTIFDGYSCTSDYLFHVVRKRTEKVRHIKDVETKDGWKLQVVTLLIVNRKTDAAITTKVRKMVDDQMASSAKKNSIDGFVKEIIAGALQKEMKRVGNKIYPIRFSEIERIEVIKSPK